MPLKPRIGTEAQLHWDAGTVCSSAQLMGPDGEVEGVAASRQRSVLINRQSMTFSLYAGAESLRLNIQAQLLMPKFTVVRIPGQVTAGESMQCRIEAEHTQRLVLTLRGPGLERRLIVNNAEDFELEFPLPGTATVLIEAEGVDLPYCREAFVAAEQQVRIKVAPLPIGVLCESLNMSVTEAFDLSSLFHCQGILGQ